MMQRVKETESVCPRCLRRIPAVVDEEGGRVLMRKTCPDHGPITVELSSKSWYYLGLADFYRGLAIGGKKEELEYNFYVTMRCNINCPICFTNANVTRYADPSLEDVEEMIKDMQGVRLCLFGGEPTVRKDLPDIIRLILRSGNIPVLYTNGIKLEDRAYLEELRDAGLEEVHLQFDGFEERVYKVLRGKPMVASKTKALENLETLGIPTVLEYTVAHDLNEDQMVPTFEYCVSQPHIRGLFFRSYVVMGKAGLKHASSVAIEDMIERFDESTGGRISLRSVYELQRLLYAFYKLVHLRRCHYSQFTFMYRTPDGGYKLVNELFDVHGIQTALDAFRHRIREGSILAVPLFLAQVARRAAHPRSLSFIRDALSVMTGKLVKHEMFSYGESGVSDRLFIVGFGAMCEPYSFDFQVADACDRLQLTAEGTQTMPYAHLELERRSLKARGDTEEGIWLSCG